MKVHVIGEEIPMRRRLGVTPLRSRRRAIWYTPKKRTCDCPIIPAGDTMRREKKSLKTEKQKLPHLKIKEDAA